MQTKTLRVKKKPQDGDSRQNIANLCMVMHLHRNFGKLLMGLIIAKIVGLTESSYYGIITHVLFLI